MRPSDIGASDGPENAKAAPEYLAMARELSAAAAEEADLDSVKAFGILVCDCENVLEHRGLLFDYY